MAIRHIDRAHVSDPTSLHQPEVVILTPPMSILQDFASYSPSRDALYARLLSNFTGRGRPKGERTEALNVSIELTPQEAIRGVTVPVGVPAFAPCHDCRGSGYDWLAVYTACGGQGTIEREQAVPVRIPPLTQQGAVIEVSLKHLGIQNFFLRLHIDIRWDARATLWIESTA